MHLPRSLQVTILRRVPLFVLFYNTSREQFTRNTQSHRASGNNEGVKRSVASIRSLSLYLSRDEVHPRSRQVTVLVPPLMMVLIGKIETGFFHSCALQSTLSDGSESKRS